MNLLLSDCGKYIAMKTNDLDGSCWDVIAVDGSCLWLHGRYQPTGYDDQDPRFLYAEHPHLVTSYLSHCYENKVGRWIYDFELGFSDHDTSLKIKRFEGNTVLKSYRARFRTPVKKLAWKYKAKKQ